MVDFLTPEDVAKNLGVTRQWITKLLRDGRIDATKIGRNWFITKEDFKTFLASRRKRKRSK